MPSHGWTPHLPQSKLFAAAALPISRYIPFPLSANFYLAWDYTVSETAPNLFISYSWTSPEHERWVSELVEELNANGVHVLFDKWDLKEGEETNAFMEQMVTNSSVTKVLMICDRQYVDRADKRERGVGTETQIISSKIYQANHSKFVAAVREYDDEGKPCLPAYYTSRIYIDLCDGARYAQEFERLLRWIYDQPLNPRPPLGSKPAFLSQERASVKIGTTTEHRRAIDALKNDKSIASAAVADYLTALSEGFESFRIRNESRSAGNFDDLVIQSIEDFLPYRNEAIELFKTLARYRADENTQRALHRFFEKLLAYNRVPSHINAYNESDFDNFKFITHELLLHAAAAFIAEEKFEFLDALLSTPFYTPGRSAYGRDATVSFCDFWQHPESLDVRSNRMNSHAEVLHAQLLKTRAGASGHNFSQLMQADFSLYLRYLLVAKDTHDYWYPVTLIYTSHHTGAFEIYARSKSEKYWNRMRPLLANPTLEELRGLVRDIDNQEISVPKFDYRSLAVRTLLGITAIATIP